ncbi:tetratricopeptide repeat protein [Algoriphagus sp.]|uniref:tetratricopeptide repeat protein n=1 Tax=Algoriphagus sp. TaxID=1872435 RepID=UPI00391946D3
MDQEELINAYLEGTLSPEDQKLFENLVEQNPEYRAELEVQRKLKAVISLSERESLRGFLENIESSTKPRATTSLKSWLYSASAACLVVMAGYFLWTTLSMSPGEKLYARHYETYPNLVAPSSRGESSSGMKAEAFLAYDNGDFAKAAGFFEQLQAQPNSDFALLYLGICQLELGRPEKAIPILNRISSKSESKEIASWYEALGYFKLNMLDKGKAALQVTAAKPNPFQNESQEILKTLK